jgi:hypothetical protein
MLLVAPLDQKTNILILRSRMAVKAPGFNPAKRAPSAAAFRPGASLQGTHRAENQSTGI